MSSKEPRTPAEALYADIIDLPRPLSPHHRPISNYSRAAQFASFDALSGFGDAVDETARLTDARITLTEDKKQMLDETLRLLCAMADTPPPVRVTYFLPDGRKAGGSCITVTGEIKETDPLGTAVVFTDKRKLPIEDILEIEILN